jgi:hypothetical protein
MRLFLVVVVWILRATLAACSPRVLENLALRQQLGTYARSQKRPRLKPGERALWVALSRVWQGWPSPLALVKPATVIDWHRRGFRRWRSREPGRPRIPAEHIALIRRISSDQTRASLGEAADPARDKVGQGTSVPLARQRRCLRSVPRPQATRLEGSPLPLLPRCIAGRREGYREHSDFVRVQHDFRLVASARRIG